ncbi:MAG: EpsG family protein, partial [Clostridia bacterium]|nr:EpsG family protein [Clostridia bacterium]
MAIYLLNMALILLWAGLLIYKNPTDQNKKMYCGLVAIQWTLISGLRHISIGADTEAYKMYFE